jgi:tetratricopeptide (TPR) repeat protein
MRRLRRLLPPIALALFAVACTSWAGLPSVTDRAWVRARSRHFTVFSNMGRGDAVEVARKLERLTEVLAATNPGLAASSPRITQVFAFRGAQSFSGYQRTGTENVAGYFASSDDLNRIVYDASASIPGNDVLYHEFVHGYLARNFAHLPLWLNEGLAMYYSTFVAGESTAEIGRLLPHAHEWLNDHRLFTTEELFAVDADSPTYRRGDRRTVFYCQSWALVHFMLHSTPENKQTLVALLDRLAEGKSAAAAEREAISPEAGKTLIDGLHEYLGRARIKWIDYQFPRKFDPAEVRVEDMSHAEVLFQLGDLLRSLGEDKSAEEHVRAALVADPSHAPSIALLGYLKDVQGRTSQAESLYLAAGEADPKEPAVYRFAGRGALKRYLKSATMGTAPPELAAARVRFARCLEFDPGDLEALIGFGRASRYEAKPMPVAVDALKAATSAEPARLDVRIDLICLLGRLERCAEADSVYQALEPCGEKDVLRSAVNGLIACRMSRASQRMQAGDSGEAMKLLDLDPVVKDPAAREYAHGEVARVHLVPAASPALVASGDPAADFNAAMESFNAGLKAANRGDYAGALADFEKARARTKWPDLVQQIDAASASVKARLRIRDGIARLNAGDPGGARETFRAVLSSSIDDSTRRYVERLVKRADARVAIESGVKMAKRGESAAASSTLDSLSGSDIDDDLRAYARALGNHVDTRVEVGKGIALLKAGSLDQALAHFETLQSSPTSASMRLYIRNLITHTRARIDVARAIEMIDARRFADARATLSEVLERPIGSHLRAYVEGLMAQMESPRRGR